MTVVINISTRIMQIGVPTLNDFGGNVATCFKWSKVYTLNNCNDKHSS